MSKAFLRSKKTTALTKPRLTFKDQLSVALINAVTVEWSVRKPDCVVPENIQTPTTEGIGNSRGVGGSEAQEIPEGRGVGP